MCVREELVNLQYPYYYPVRCMSASFLAPFNSLLHTQIGILACVTPQDVDSILTAYILGSIESTNGEPFSNIPLLRITD